MAAALCLIKKSQWPEWAKTGNRRN